MNALQRQAEGASLHQSAVRLPVEVLIERAGPGDMLLQALSANYVADFPTPTGVKPEGDKAVRLEAATTVIERGAVLLRKQAHWLDDFLLELLGFPNGRHDDQADALSQLLNWNITRQRGPLVGCGPEVYCDGRWSGGQVFKRE